MKCPICKKEILKSGIRNHITNMAKSELFNINPNPKHYRFYLKNRKALPNGKQTLKYTKI